MHTPHARALRDVGVIPDAPEKILKLDEDFWLDVEDSPWTNLHKATMTLGDLDAPCTKLKGASIKY